MLKRIINGKLYNTETAKEIATWDNGCSSSDFQYESETLYRKKNGEFFLEAEGGPLSRYAVRYGSNSWSGSERIIPLTVSETKDWLEENDFVDNYLELFGEPAE